MHIEQSDFHDQLVRGLTHKMNNILSLFHGYLGLLLEDKKLDADTLDGLARIRQGATAASELMDRTTAFVKPPSTVWREVNVEELLRQLTPTMNSFLERDVTVRIMCEEEMPRLWVDASRFRTAILEIVRNACEASPARGVVTIDARTDSTQSREGAGTASQPVSWLALTVSDTGGGIAPEIHRKIFQPFFSTKQKLNAMGLGLSVAMGLVQQMGGVIRFESQPGKTRFLLLLPSRTEVR